MHPRSTRWRRAAIAVVVVTSAATIAVTLVQRVNTRRVRDGLCDLLADGADCAARSGLASVVVDGRLAGPRASGRAHAPIVVSTSLLRRTCRGGWTLDVGGRADLSETVVTTGLGDLDVRDACVATDGGSWDAAVRQASLAIRGCVLRLAPVRLDAGRVVNASVDASLDPATAPACAALLQGPAATALAGSTVRVTMRYEPSDTSPVIGALLDAVRRRDVRQALTRVKSSHAVDAAVAGDSASLRIDTEPTGGSAAVHLTMRATPALAALLPADVAPTPGRAALDVAWDLRHATGVVRVNGEDRRRLPVAPTRPAGLVALPASECGALALGTRSLHFVEADDHGRALRPAQGEAAQAAVDAAMRSGGALVTVFVHGWQHSAAPGDSYVCRFADIVASIEHMESGAAARAGRPARRVVGIYIGWPGTLYDSPLANTATTFWDRLRAADSLGSGGGVLPSLLTRLGQRVAEGRAEARADRRSSLVVVGHSMGARAVFRAVRDDLLRGRAASGVAPDMTLLVNPAFSADLYRAVHALGRDCAAGSAPVLLFSSEADAVTRQVYPAGQSLNYAPGAAEPTPFLEHVYTAANFGEFVTHRLALEVVSGAPPEPDGAQTILRGALRVPAGSRELYDENPVVVYRQPASGRPRPGDAWYRLRLTALPGVRDCGAAGARSRVVAVDPRVIPDHGRIFTPPFVEYVARVLNAQASQARAPRD